MSRVPQSVVKPEDPQSITEHLYRVQRVVDGRLEFGSPQDPTDPTSTTLADGATHNGTILNMEGSWVEVDVEALDTATTFTHNLDAPIISATASPNVCWLVMRLQHSGAGVLMGVDTISVNYEIGDTITTNSIQLRFYAGGTRTVNAGNPIRAALFFVRGVR